MPLTNKFLRYSPEITLEIFTLVYNKLVGLKWAPNEMMSIRTMWKEFDVFPFLCDLGYSGMKLFGTFSASRYNDTEITVQEILGYDPFVKDFVLPEKWYCPYSDKEEFDIMNKFFRGNWAFVSIDGFNGCTNLLNCNHWFSRGKISDDIIKITFDQFKKYILKESIETPKEVIPEYVECTFGYDGQFTKGKIYKLTPTKSIYQYEIENCDNGLKNAWVKQNFKPSTKEAFDAQNKPKTIEKWSPETYVVCIKEYGAYLKVGDVAQIEDGDYRVNEDCVDISKSVKNPCMPFKDWCKWFATKSEAEEFAKTLVEEEVKQPLKQAVHCKTKEEWDFVSDKIGYKFKTKFELRNNDTINPAFQSCECKSFYEKRSKYNLLSFQEWCDLNGYKMEKEVKFEVGKWYQIQYDFGNYIGKFKKELDCSFEFYYMYRYESSKFIDGITSTPKKVIQYSELFIEEIQQYLPDDHPDKIKSNDFKVGDYVFAIGNIREYEKPTIGQLIDFNDGDSYNSRVDFNCNNNKKCSIWSNVIRHATPEEINSHLISIGQIPAGEPLNTGIEPNKDGMFKYKSTLPGTSWSGGTIQNHLDAMIPTTGNSYNKDFSTSIIPVKSISTEVEFNFLPEPE